jgi:hypothetical protein
LHAKDLEGDLADITSPFQGNRIKIYYDAIALSVHDKKNLCFTLLLSVFLPLSCHASASWHPEKA